MKEEIKTICYKQYRLLSVYNQITPELEDKIILLWNKNGILPEGENSRKRVKQVAIVILDQNEKVVGVSTVYTDFRPVLKEDAFMYRMFIQPPDRIAGMMIQVVRATYLLLDSFQVENKPKSLMIISENPKLMRPGTRRELKKLGFIFLGQDQRACDIWRWPFTH